MTILDTFKQYVSKFTDRPIFKGIGISTDEAVKLNNLPSIDDHERSLVNNCATYVLRQRAGRFELVGLTKHKDKTNYKLRHVYTDETFTVSETLFYLLFMKLNTIEECND